MMVTCTETTMLNGLCKRNLRAWNIWMKNSILKNAWLHHYLQQMRTVFTEANESEKDVDSWWKETEFLITANSSWFYNTSNEQSNLMIIKIVSQWNPYCDVEKRRIYFKCFCHLIFCVESKPKHKYFSSLWFISISIQLK